MSTRSPIWDSNMLDLVEGQNVPGCLDNEPQWNKFHIWHAVIFPWLCPMPLRASLGNSLSTSISLSSASIDVEILSPDLQLHCEHKVNVMISPRHDESSYDKQWKRFILGGGSSATLQVSPRYGMTYFKFSSSQVRPGLRNDTDTKVAAWPSRSHDLVIHHHPLTLNCHTWLVKDADSVQTVVCPIHDTVSSVVSLTNVSSSLGISGIAGTSVVSSSLTIIHTHMHNNEPVFPQTKKIYPASSKVHLSTSANLQIKQTYVNVAATSDAIIQTAGSISWAQTNIDSGTGFSSTTDLSPTRELTSTYTKRERFFRS